MLGEAEVTSVDNSVYRTGRSADRLASPKKQRENKDSCFYYTEQSGSLVHTAEIIVKKPKASPWTQD